MEENQEEAEFVEEDEVGTGEPQEEDNVHKDELLDAQGLPSDVEQKESEYADFICKRCKQKYEAEDMFINHLRSEVSCRKYYEHTFKDEDVKPTFLLNLKVACDECGKKFKNEVYLDRHVKQVHESHAWEFECDQCDKRFEYRAGLIGHIKSTHNTPIPAKYVKAEQAKDFACGDCGKRFANVRGLKAHREAMHVTKEVRKPFKCSESGCDRRFGNRTQLAKHKDLHHEYGQLYFVCYDCGMTFVYDYALRKHQDLYHSGKETFDCLDCNQKFLKQDKLEFHVQAKHSNTVIKEIKEDITG